MKTLVFKLEQKITVFLSHRPKLYALSAGIGIILFWRGVWHTADQLHSCFVSGYLGCSTTDAFTSPWWDGPLSFLVGTTILYFTGALVSSFIGNELILSGLRGEKRLTEKTEGEIKGEVHAISDIKEALKSIEDKIDDFEKKSHNHNRS
jgi:hypothetical protein